MELRYFAAVRLDLSPLGDQSFTDEDVGEVLGLPVSRLLRVRPEDLDADSAGLYATTHQGQAMAFAEHMERDGMVAVVREGWPYTLQQIHPSPEMIMGGEGLYFPYSFPVHQVH